MKQLTTRRHLEHPNTARNREIVRYAMETREPPTMVARHFGLVPNVVRTILCTARARGIAVPKYVSIKGAQTEAQLSARKRLKARIIALGMRKPKLTAPQIEKMIGYKFSVTTIRRLILGHVEATSVEPPAKPLPVVYRPKTKGPPFPQRSVAELIALGLGVTKIAALKRMPYSEVIAVADRLSPYTSTLSTGA